MRGLIAFGWIWVIACLIFLLVLGVSNLIAYRSTEPENVDSFEAVRSSENDFRTIVAPAIAALITGLLVSLSATFAYDAVTGKGEPNYPAIFGFLMAALVTLILLLQPLLRGEMSAEKLTQHPQRIYLAAKSIDAAEEDASAQIERLRYALANWTTRSGAFSMGWTDKTKSPLLNAAFREVPANDELPLGSALRLTARRQVFRAALRTAPWRFGWPLIFLLVPLVGVVIGSFSSNWPDMWPFLAALVLPFVVVSLMVYWAGLLVLAVRRLAISRSFVPLCDAEFESAEARVRTHVARQVVLDSIPGAFRMIAVSARRSERWAVIGAAVGFLSASALALHGLKRR